MNKIRLYLLITVLYWLSACSPGGAPSTASPEAKATATRARALPTPTLPATQPQSPLAERSLEIVRDHVIACRESAGSPVMAGDFWAAWEVKVNSQNYWVSSGDGTVLVQAPNGAVVNTVPARFGLAADQIGWVVPRTFSEGNAIEGKGSKVEIVSLELGGIQWEPSDGSPAQYDQVQLTFLQHQVSAGEYPRHWVTVNIYNGSEFAMNTVSLFGLILDGNGDPVDIVFSDRVDLVPFGSTTTLVATSTSPTGRCIGPKDLNDYYEVHYWVDFLTYSEELVTLYAVEKGEAWNYEKAVTKILETLEATILDLSMEEVEGERTAIVKYQVTNHNSIAHTVAVEIEVTAHIWGCTSGNWFIDTGESVHGSTVIGYQGDTDPAQPISVPPGATVTGEAQAQWWPVGGYTIDTWIERDGCHFELEDAKPYQREEPPDARYQHGLVLLDKVE